MQPCTHRLSLLADPAGDITQVTDSGRAVAYFDVAYTLLTRLDAVYEVAGVVIGFVQLDRHALKRDALPFRIAYLEGPAVDTDLPLLANEQGTAIGISILRQLQMDVTGIGHVDDGLLGAEEPAVRRVLISNPRLVRLTFHPYFGRAAFVHAQGPLHLIQAMRTPTANLTAAKILDR